MSSFMTKRRSWIGLAALILVAIVAVAVWPGPKEPEYQGKKLSEWLAIQDEFSPHPAAEDAIIRIGTNNIPLLLRWLDYKPSKLREWVNDHLDNQPKSLQFFVRNRGGERADAAEEIFRILGMRAVSAIPELLRQAQQHVDGPDMRAFNCLTYMAEVSFPAVASVATNKQSPARYEATACIGGMTNLGTNRVPAVRLLCALALDSDRDVADDALMALGRLGAEADIALPALIRSAKGSDIRLAETALRVVGEFGTRAAAVLPDLISALDHQDFACRLMATNAVNEIAPEFFRTNGVEVGEFSLKSYDSWLHVSHILINSNLPSAGHE